MDEVKRISWAEYFGFCARIPYDSADWFRVGQRFLNQFYQGVIDPDLYYCTDADECRRMIMDRYVDVEEG